MKQLGLNTKAATHQASQLLQLAGQSASQLVGLVSEAISQSTSYVASRSDNPTQPPVTVRRPLQTCWLERSCPGLLHEVAHIQRSTVENQSQVVGQVHSVVYLSVGFISARRGMRWSLGTRPNNSTFTGVHRVLCLIQHLHQVVRLG